MSFWSSTLRTGRKEHRCATCNRAVPKGEKSYVEAGVSDGDFTSYRSCVPCHDLVKRLYAAGHLETYETWYLGDLGEIAIEAGETFPPLDAAALNEQPRTSESESQLLGEGGAGNG